jgi:hypothetical protein
LVYAVHRDLRELLCLNLKTTALAEGGHHIIDRILSIHTS